MKSHATRIITKRAIPIPDPLISHSPQAIVQLATQYLKKVKRKFVESEIER